MLGNDCGVILLKKVLTIAGSDCSGGAGIQADIKTIIMHKMYAMSVVTSMTAQNTMGVFSIVESSPEFISAQLDAVFTDIFPDSVKIGMVSNAQSIDIILKKLKQYNAKNIVVDPVMVSTSKCRLIPESAVQAITDCLFPIATIVTPNIFEAGMICGFSVENEHDMLKAAEKIAETFKGAILIKGGHLARSADDLLYQDGNIKWFRSDKIDNPNTHGTGCTLSSAIACNLASGATVEESVRRAKIYLGECLKSMLNLGKGSGPINHLNSKFM